MRHPGAGRYGFVRINWIMPRGIDVQCKWEPVGLKLADFSLLLFGEHFVLIFVHFDFSLLTLSNDLVPKDWRSPVTCDLQFSRWHSGVKVLLFRIDFVNNIFVHNKGSQKYTNNYYAECKCTSKRKFSGKQIQTILK